jgi:hypothetical protein
MSTDAAAGMRAVWAAALLSMAAVVILCLATHGDSRAASLAQLQVGSESEKR